MYETIFSSNKGKVVRTFAGYDVLTRRMVNYDGIHERDIVRAYTVYDNGYAKEHTFGFTYKVGNAPDFDAKVYAVNLLEKEGR